MDENKRWLRVLILFGVVFVVLFVTALWFRSYVHNHEGRGEKSQYSPNTRVNHPARKAEVTRQRTSLTANVARLVADIGKNVSDVRDGCLSMCYDMEINPKEWLRCLVRSWGIPSSIY